VKIWKVILATVVIFAAGALAGGILVKTFGPKPDIAKPPVPGILSQQRFQSRLKEKLELTPEQTNRIDKIFAESNERIRILWGLIGPELQKELTEVRDNIRAELTPEQREKFEQLLKSHRSDGRRGSRGSTNQTNSGEALK
jgi:Spy/CpxP family protein refolding chaperone